MVRALLDGRKTQTRRIMKPQPIRVDGGVPFGDAPEWACAEPGSMMIRCPFGKTRDRLWVREAWCGEIDATTSKLIYNNDGNTYKTLYKADGKHVFLDDGDGGVKTNQDGSEASPWKPSIHMPRWASRITLEIVSVWVERLQDISEEDAMAEGISKESVESFSRTAGIIRPAGFAYRELWNSINKKARPTLPHNTASKRYARIKRWLETHPDNSSWDANPWVWVVQFRVALNDPR